MRLGSLQRPYRPLASYKGRRRVGREREERGREGGKRGKLEQGRRFAKAGSVNPN